MASPTETEVFTQLKNVVNIYEKLRVAAEATGISGSVDWTTLEDTFITSLETDFAVEATEAIAASRSRLDGLLRDAASAMAPIIRQLGRTNNFPETDVLSILGRQYRRMVDDSADRIKGRAFTFGTPSAASSNTGGGTILRLTKDADNFDIENQHVDAKTATCVADSNTGTNKHEEIFEFRGQAPGRDSLEVSGSGAVANIAAISARNSLLSNPSFSRHSGTSGSNLTFTDWTWSGGANELETDTTNYYRDFLGDTTPTAAVISGNGTLSQALSVRNVRLSADTPYFLQVAYHRDVTTGQTVSTTGATMVVHMGTQTTNVDLTTGTGWQLARVPSSAGQNNWPKNFNEADLDIKLVFSGLSTGEEVVIDDILFVPWIPFDGSWYVVVGDQTKFLLDDKFTWTDTATDSVLQRWLWRAFGVYLPHDQTSGITIADPT